jgi:hypothetical protein
VPTPPPLRRTGRIAVAAPASAPLDDARYQAGLAALRARGLTVETPREAFAEHGFLAGPDADRLEEFNALLRRDDLDAVSRRMGHLASLRLLSRDESRQYMQHRVRIAGGREFPFDDQATEAVFELTRGNPRAIDHLSRKSLEWAALSGHPVVDTAAVTAARARLLP